MNYLLIDVFDNAAYNFIVPQSRHALIEVRPPRKPGRKEWQWLKGVLKVLRKSRKGDKLVFVFDFQAVLAWWIALLAGRERTIICLNLLLDQHSGWRNRMVSALYRKALPARNFHATVTSREYGVWLNEALGIDVPYTLLRDVFHASYKSLPDSRKCDVFCGGRNGRDWDFYVRLATSLPGVSFTAVMSGREAGKRGPANLRILQDLPEEAFASALAASKLVCLPLYKQAPAGLIVLFQAAANRKPVIMTDTPATRAYCMDGRGILLPNEIDRWQKAIRFCLDNPARSQDMAGRLLSFCQTECSEQKYVDGIDQLLD